MPLYKEKFIELDKIYHKILEKYWYSWTFWEILKQKPIIINNLNKIRELHKLRNKLVHELESQDMPDFAKKCIEYEKEIKILLI